VRLRLQYIASQNRGVSDIDKQDLGAEPKKLLIQPRYRLKQHSSEGCPKYIQIKNMMLQLIQDITLILQTNNKDKPSKRKEPRYRNHILNKLYTLAHFPLYIYLERVLKYLKNRASCNACQKSTQKEKYGYAIGNQSTSLNSFHQMISALH